MTKEADKPDSAADDHEVDHDPDAPVAQRVCGTCGKVAPRTQTAHTLISAKHGWRLQPAREPTHEAAYEWWCPDCWKEHKALSVT